MCNNFEQQIFDVLHELVKPKHYIETSKNKVVVGLHNTKYIGGCGVNNIEQSFYFDSGIPIITKRPTYFRGKGKEFK